ncbi:helix-turn-helix transcriptional regulator [uncultured Rothia sp.]|uniref:helix-turn-helix domain-containing protein n=1 Tax=uncultured Rothia sp. TaxID=316088 RepID=UPI0032163F1C
MARGTKEPPTLFTLCIHAELRAWAGRRNISYRQLAEKAGLSRERVRKTISADETPLDTNELDRICKALGVSPEYIVDRAVENMDMKDYALAAESDDQQDLDEGEMY